jgi:intracellular sulfur oxidation DsrE/DsrF family protein
MSITKTGFAFAAAAALFVSVPAFADGTVVYHINDAANTKTLLANLQNHVVVDPAAKIYVVSNGTGINAFLKDAKDENGNAYEPQVQSLAKQGVHFEVCNNSLKKRGLNSDAVVGEASIVPAGVVEIARLQSEEKAAYIKP